MRLIDADKLMEECYEELEDDSLWHDEDTSKDYADGHDEGKRIMMAIIDQAPTIDAVEVVRSDCTGCRFVGTYDTTFPCAVCARKTKDYYEPQTERRQVMSSGMNVEQAKEYAKTMTYRQAVANCFHARGIQYRKATKIKLRELAEIADRLVTCQECKYWGDTICERFEEERIMFANDFCSYGDRKDEQLGKDINVRSKDEPQTETPRCSVNGTPFDECGFCEHFNCDTCKCDAPQTERSE